MLRGSSSGVQLEGVRIDLDRYYPRVLVVYNEKQRRVQSAAPTTEANVRAGQVVKTGAEGRRSTRRGSVLQYACARVSAISDARHARDDGYEPLLLSFFQTAYYRRAAHTSCS